MLTDDQRPHYGKLPGVHPRARKMIFTSDKCHMDGEDATQSITIGTMLQREVFVDQLPDVICFEGVKGLQDAFKEWLESIKTEKSKK